MAALGDAGWLKYTVPLDYGGVRETLDVRSLCLLRETFGYASGLAEFAFAMQGLGSGPISLFGSEALKRRYLPAVAAGRTVAAFAISEAGAGSDIGAMTTTVGISEVMKNRVHFNTFGGNPISMTQGLATLEIIDEENIQQNALDVGTHLKESLLDLQDKHELIGEVRGLGLMLGVELVRDRYTKEPANTEAAEVMELMKERRVLVGKGGLFGNTLRVKPPMCITKEDADYLVAMLDEVLGELRNKGID